MNMKKTMMIAAAVCVVGLGGCDKGAKTVPAPASYAVKAVAAKTDAKVDFSVDVPQQCAAEAPTNLVVTVKWTFRDAALSKVKIMVGEDLAHARLFSEAGGSGSEKTGPWGRPGLSFFALDDAGQLLAQVNLEDNRCASKE